MMKKIQLLMLIMILGSVALNALEMSPGVSLGAELGISRGDNAGSNERIGPLVRGHVQLEIFPYLYMRNGLGYTILSARDDYSTSTFLGDVRLVLSPWEEKKVAPFIYAGAGASYDFKHKDADVIPLFPFGIGTKIKVKEGMALEISAGYNYSNSDMLDNTPHDQEAGNSLIAGEGKDGFFNLSLGLHFSDTGKKAKEEAPKAPPVMEKPVEPTKTPPPPKPEVTPRPTPDLKTMDSDGDGLSDYDEIHIYGTDPYKADTDGDGLSDYAEVMKYKTDPLNPDTDGDGLTDYDEVMKYKTDPLNPDTDGDGLSDYDEVMVHKADPLDPDTDKGGMNDGEEVAQGKDPLDPSDDFFDITTGASFDLEGIMFDTAKYEILPVSVPVLEHALKVLKEHPEVKVLIVGHTDSVGGVQDNLILSRNRANAVKNWLVDRGIATDRIRTDGKGKAEPKTTNETVEGRAINRRIEFIIE